MFQTLRRMTLSVGNLTALAALVATLLAGCADTETGPVTAERSRYEVAEDSPGESGREPSAPFSTPLDDDDAEPSLPDLPTGRDAPPTDVPTELPADADYPPSPPGFDQVGQPDFTELPDDPDELIERIHFLHALQPRGQTEQDQYEDYLRIQRFRVEVAEKLLSVATESEQRVAAVQTKLDAMRTMTLVGVPGMEQQLSDYSESLLEDADEESVFLGRLMLFGLAIDELAEGADVAVEDVLEDLEGLAADGQDNPGVFMVIRQAAGILQALGEREAALQAYQTIGESFEDSEDPQMAAEARTMFERIRIIEVGLDERLRDVLMNRPDSEEPVLAAITELLADADINLGILSELAQAAQFLEMSDRYPLAGEVWERIEAAYRDHPDEELAEQAVQQAQNGLTRIELIGNPLTVDGVTVAGEPFDWADYEGQVVLIDFWATWSEPCLREMPYIAQVYRQYQDRGFEVVGINLDDDPETVRRFLDFQPLPWPTLISADETAQGLENPLVARAGVDSLPFMVLVGTDGNVAALHVRGPRLQEKLAEKLGEPAGVLPEPVPGMSPQNGEESTDELLDGLLEELQPELP